MRKKIVLTQTAPHNTGDPPSLFSPAYGISGYRMENQVLWGWEAFFSKLAMFLRQLEREEGIAKQQFSEYTLERLQLIIVAVGSVRSGFHAFENDHGLREAVLYYLSSMDELLD